MLKEKSLTIVNNDQEETTRNIGIELLRIIATLMIIILHFIGHNKILENTQPLSFSNDIIYFLKILCFVSVNLYALITGYVYVKSKHKWERIIELWLQVTFYTFLITIIFFIMPQKIFNVKFVDIVKSLLPVMSGEYWYFTSYFCLFLFIPFINILIKNMTKKQHQKIIFLSLFAFSIISLIAQYLGGDIFRVFEGFSFLWLAVMYIIGAYIKLYPEDFKKCQSYYFLIYILCSIIVLFTEILFSQITLNSIGTIKYNTFFMKYNSPFIVVGSISLFIFFTRLKIKTGTKIITNLASTSFGVYIISEQKYLRSLFIVDKFTYFAYLPIYLTVIYIIMTSAIIYLICFCIEYIRIKLFKILHVREFAINIKNAYNHICIFIIKQIQ